MPATGPYRFVRYRTASKLTATIENPLTGKVVAAAVSHLLPYKGKEPKPLPPRDDIGPRKRVRLHALEVACRKQGTASVATLVCSS